MIKSSRTARDIGILAASSGLGQRPEKLGMNLYEDEMMDTSTDDEGSISPGEGGQRKPQEVMTRAF